MAAVKRVYESEKKIYIDERRFTEGWHHHGHHHRNKIIVPFQSKVTSFGWCSSLLVNRWRWRLSSIIIMGPKCFVSGTGTPETGRAKQKEEQSEHHPTHHDHGERQVIPSSSLSAGTRQFLGAVSVCAVGLRLPEQVEKASHCIFMGTDTLTRVKASLCHFEPPC